MTAKDSEFNTCQPKDTEFKTYQSKAKKNYYLPAQHLLHYSQKPQNELQLACKYPQNWLHVSQNLRICYQSGKSLSIYYLLAKIHRIHYQTKFTEFTTFLQAKTLRIYYLPAKSTRL